MDKSRAGTENVLYEYYNNMQQYRVAKPIVQDINLLADCVHAFNPKKSIKVLGAMVYKYKEPINQVGKYLTGIVTLGKPELYKQKTEQDLLFDLIYLMRVLMLVGATKAGLVPSLAHAVRAVKADGISLNTFDLYAN